MLQRVSSFVMYGGRSGVQAFSLNEISIRA